MPGVLRTLWTGWLGGVRLVRSVDPSVVIVNTVTVPLWLPLSRAVGRPCVSHVHEAEASASSTMRRLLALPLLAATEIMVNSTFSRDVLVRSIPALESRTVLVRNAVPGPDGGPTPARHDLDGAVRLVYVGRLSERKGVDVAVRSLAELRRRGVEAELVVVGAVYPGYEWFEESLRRLIDDLDAAAHVSLVGFQVDVWPLVADADIVLVPSRVDEPFGNTAVEATLAGRPCVVSDIGGLREAAGQHTFASCPPGREDAVAHAVQSIMGDWTSYRRRALEDAAVAEVKHGIQPYSDRVLAVIDRAARTTRRARRRRRRASR